jgi:hypothetical protein
VSQTGQHVSINGCLTKLDEIGKMLCIIAPTICMIVSERSVHKVSESKFIFENMHRPVGKTKVLVKWFSEISDF